MNVFGIGLPEMVLIMGVALLIFGPKKLPEIGRSMGKAIKGFQDASREFKSEFDREAELLEKPVEKPTEKPKIPVAVTSAPTEIPELSIEAQSEPSPLAETDA
jgi:sec-independent protein translocase protein TatA